MSARLLRIVWASLLLLVMGVVIKVLGAEPSVGSVTPTGNFAVGRTLFHWTDSHRTDPVAAEPRTKREFMVIVWYPAETQDSSLRALWMPDQWAVNEASLLYGQRLDSKNPLTIGQAQQAIRLVVSNSIAEAPLAQDKASWPVLLFAPGAGVNTASYSTFTEDLASHGYVVFGIVPTGWVATTFPDGRYVPDSNKRSDNVDWITGTALPLWVDDLRFMLDQIEGLNKNSNSAFLHRLDLSRVGAFGHSFGGTASILAGLQDARIKAVLNLDGSPFGVLSKRVLPKPFMVVKHNISPKYAIVPPDKAGKAMQARVEEELSSVYLQGRPGYRVGVADATHMTFSDMAVLETWADAGRRFGAENASDGARTLAVICDYIRAFFDRFLLGQSSSLLERQGKAGICVLDLNVGSKVK
jgi:predicted dienelactone hydrolase